MKQHQLTDLELTDLYTRTEESRFRIRCSCGEGTTDYKTAALAWWERHLAREFTVPALPNASVYRSAVYGGRAR